MTDNTPLLIVGEIIVDFTTARPGAECKLRLGGIVHAGRGLWACGIAYAVAAVCPGYLVKQARNYLGDHGCRDFVWLGDVAGSPNIIIIGDATEVSDQGYKDLLREEKLVSINEIGDALRGYPEVLVFPGSYPLADIGHLFAEGARLNFDVAYDAADFSLLAHFSGRLNAVIISTSSPLFLKVARDDVTPMIDAVRDLGAKVFLLKENRGGSRLFDLEAGGIEHVPAILSNTVNSVGVGDVYSAVMIGLQHLGWDEAAWRGLELRRSTRGRLTPMTSSET